MSCTSIANGRIAWMRWALDAAKMGNLFRNGKFLWHGVSMRPAALQYAMESAPFHQEKGRACWRGDGARDRELFACSPWLSL